MTAIIRIARFLFVIVLFISCTKDTMTNELFFIGDSNVEFWDVQYDFPEFITHNYGKAGAGIELLKEFKNQFYEKIVVVIVGTNDVDNKISYNVDEYSSDYVKSICNLGAKRIFLISIFPQSNTSTFKETNAHILELNRAIRQLIIESNVEYIDMTCNFLLDDGFNPEFTFDGRHLNRQGYEIVASKIRRAL